MVWLLLAVPLVAGLLALVIPWHVPRRMLLIATVITHAGLAAVCIAQTPRPVFDGWIAIDSIAAVFLMTTSFVFLIASFYAVGYLAREGRRIPHASANEPPFGNSPEAIFTGCYLLFLGAITWVLVSQHWGLMWIAVEATTLASAPLIHFHRHPRSLEATWKYLVICSVGIALALLGNFFLAVAVRSIPGGPQPLTIGNLEMHARQLDPLWLKAAFLLLLVGYGTKMGLAPMHTWLPDAHSEAPSVVSALLSGVLLNCAFLAILRGHSLLVKAGLGDFSRELLVLFGLLSMVVAALFIINQLDYKRMLAYSSVEHMGILALGAGVGGMAGFGSLLHAMNHSVAKSMLFLAAGNTLAWFHSRSTRQARGILRSQRLTGMVWMVGLLAITGSPPFGTFLRALAILRGILDAGRPWVAILYLGALSLAFVGMSAVILPMVYGVPVPAGEPAAKAVDGIGDSPAMPPEGRAAEPLWSVLPMVILALAAFVLGIYLPHELTTWLHLAAASVGAE
ncbi:MAG: proton-conducting transporter transmembrane domain-containing protein [Pirellulaceae bacterium]